MACTLLVNHQNSLKYAAKGRIIWPQNRRFHNQDMPDNVHRVRVDRALPECAELYPPNQPPEEDTELKICQLKNHMLLWPKALIRLNDASGSTPSQEKATKPVAPPPRRVTPPVPPHATPSVPPQATTSAGLPQTIKLKECYDTREN